MKGQDTAMHLITSWILKVPKGDHIMVVSKSLIKTGKNLHLTGVQEGSIPHLVRDVRSKSRRMRRFRVRVRGTISWHVKDSK